MRRYKVGKREREREKWGGESAGRDIGRKKTSERGRGRGREGGNCPPHAVLASVPPSFSRAGQKPHDLPLCVSADGQHCDVLLLCGACSRGGGLCPKAQPAR